MRDHCTTKIRPVTTASHKFVQPDGSKKSLNDCILQTPANIKQVMDTLMKFRLHAVSLTGDVKTNVSEGQNNSQRFVKTFILMERSLY